MRRLRKLLKWSGIILLVLLLLIVSAATTLIFTDWGRRQTLGIVRGILADTFEKGGVDIASIEGDPFRTLTLRGLVVRDSRDAPMVKTDWVEAELNVWALLQHQVRITKARSAPLTIRVQYDEDGVYYPLVMPSPTSEPTPPSTSPPWLIIIDQFTASNTYFAYEETNTVEEGKLPVYDVTSSSLDLGLAIYPDQIKIYVHNLDALSYGLSSGAKLRGELTYLDDLLRIDWLEFGFGASRILLAGEVREFADVYQDITIFPSYVTPADLRRLLPDVPLLTSLQLEGSVRGHLQDLTTDLTAAAPNGGSAHLRYTMNLYDPWISWSLQAQGRQFDLARWMGSDFPTSRLDFSTGAIGVGFGSDALDEDKAPISGTSNIERFQLFADGSVDEYLPAKVNVIGSYRFGLLRIEDAQLEAGENRVAARGYYVGESGAGGVGAEVSLPEMEHLPLDLGLAGALFGEVNLQTNGEDTTAQLDLRAEGAKYDEYQVRSAQVKGSLGYKDERAYGQANIKAAGVNLAGFVMSSASAEVRPDAKDPFETFQVNADAALPTGEKTSLSTTITMKDTIGVDIHHGSLALTNTAQFSIGSATVEVLDDKTTWRGLRLTTKSGGELSTSGDYYFADGSLKGEVATRSLSLAPLLRSFGVVGVPVSGMMNANATLRGSAEAPLFNLRATIEQGNVAGLALGSLRVGYDGKRVTYALNPESDPSALSGEGEVPMALYQGILKKGPMNGDIHVKDLDVRQLRSFLPPEAQEAEGLISIDLTGKGDSYDPEIDGVVSLSGGAFDVWRGLGMQVEVQLTKDRINVKKVSASLENETILSANGSIELSWQHLLDAMENLDLSVVDTALDLHANLENIDLATLLPKLPEEYRKDLPLVAGQFETALDIGGTIGAPDVSFTGDLQNAEVVSDGQRLKGIGFDWDFSINEGDADLSGSLTGFGSGDVIYNANAPADLDTVLELLGKDAESVMKTLPIGAMVAIRGLDPYKLPWDFLGGQPEELGYLKQGTVGVELAIVGTMAAPTFRYVIALEDAFIAGDPKNQESLGPLFIAFDGQYDEKGVLSALSVAKSSERWFSGELRVDFPMSELVAIATGKPLPAKGPLFRLDMSSDKLLLADVTKLLNLDQEATGALAVRVNVSGAVPVTWPSPIPMVQIAANSSGMTLGSSELSRMELSASVSPMPGKPQDGRASFGLTMKGPKSKFNNELRMDGAVELHLDQENPFDEDGQVRIIAENFDIGFGRLFDPGIRRLGGWLSTSKKGLILRDPFGAPTLDGELNLSRGELVYVGLDTRIEDLVLESEFTPKKEAGLTAFEVKELTLRSGRGQASLRGDIELKSLSPEDFALTLTADEFEVPYSGSLMAKLNNFSAKIDGRFTETSLKVGIVIERGSYELPSLFSDTSKNLMPLGLPGDVLLVDGADINLFPEEDQAEAPTSSPTASTPAVIENPFSYLIDIQIPNKLSILNPPPEAKGMVSALTIQLEGSIRMESVDDTLSIVGALSLLDGSEVSLINNRFKFSKESKLTFIGEDLDPRLALEATSNIVTNTGDGTGVETYKVKLLITGTASAPVIDWNSDPFLEKAKILQLVLTGKLDSVADPGQESLLVSGISSTAQALGNSVAQLGVGLLIQNTPLAFLTNKTFKLGNVEFNLFDLINADLEHLELGWYVSDKCFLDFSARKTAESALDTDSNNLELDFSCRISGRTGFNIKGGTSSKTGNSNGSADILWSKDY